MVFRQVLIRWLIPYIVDTVYIGSLLWTYPSCVVGVTVGEEPDDPGHNHAVTLQSNPLQESRQNHESGSQRSSPGAGPQSLGAGLGTGSSPQDRQMHEQRQEMREYHQRIRQEQEQQLQPNRQNRQDSRSEGDIGEGVASESGSQGSSFYEEEEEEEEEGMQHMQHPSMRYPGLHPHMQQLENLNVQRRQRSGIAFTPQAVQSLFANTHPSRHRELQRVLADPVLREELLSNIFRERSASPGSGSSSSSSSDGRGSIRRNSSGSGSDMRGSGSQDSGDGADTEVPPLNRGTPSPPHSRGQKRAPRQDGRSHPQDGSDLRNTSMRVLRDHPESVIEQANSFASRMTFMVGNQLLRKTRHHLVPEEMELIQTQDALQYADTVILYFSAHWCPPCRRFTPEFVKSYQSMKMAGRSVAVVFVSGDRSESDFVGYYEGMPWLAMPYNVARTQGQALQQSMGIRGIPSIRIFTKNNKQIDHSNIGIVLDPTFHESLDWDPRFLLAGYSPSIPSSGQKPKQNFLVGGKKDRKEIDDDLNGVDLSKYTFNCRVFSNAEKANEIFSREDLKDGIEMEIDPSEGWEVFLFQLFSVTNIPDAQQRICGLSQNHGVMIDSDLFEASCKRLVRKYDPEWKTRTVNGNEKITLPFNAEGKAAEGSPADEGATGDVARAPDCTDNIDFAIYVLGNMSEDDPFEFAPNEKNRQLDQQSERQQQLREQYFEQKLATLNVDPSEKARVISDARKAQGYENRHLQHCCLQQIPMAKLAKKAFEKCKKKYNSAYKEAMDDAQADAEANGSENKVNVDPNSICPKNLLEFDEAFLQELLHFFKNDFFTWPKDKPVSYYSDAAVCDRYGAEGSNEHERNFNSMTTELSRCQQTGKTQRFPRYNSVYKLLETRLGRCGEWANCFTAIARACGYESRFVSDYTDHVWTEVKLRKLCKEAKLMDRERTETGSKKAVDTDPFKYGSGCWHHVDSCEASYDTPLVYEMGWGKRLTYCFAYARDHALDITRRYTNKQMGQLVAHGRNRFDEKKLPTFFKMIDSYLQEENTHQIQSTSTEFRDGRDRERCLGNRAEEEDNYLTLLQQFRARNKAKAAADPANLIGRESGDLAWRQGRGEIGVGRNSNKSGACGSNGAPAAGNGALSTVPGLRIEYRQGKQHDDTQHFREPENNAQGVWAYAFQNPNAGALKLIKISLFHGNLAKGIEFTYMKNGKREVHSHVREDVSYEEKRDLVLEKDEYINRVFGRKGDLLDVLGFGTSKGRRISAGSSTGGDPFDIFKPGEVLLGLNGGIGGDVHYIQPVWGNLNLLPAVAEEETTVAIKKDAGDLRAEAVSKEEKEESASDDKKPDSFTKKEESKESSNKDSKDSTAGSDSNVVAGNLVKELFAQYVKEGKNPNDAAKLAVIEAQKRMSTAGQS